MYSLILGLIIFIAILLVLVILAQNSKGGGLSSQFGGSSASNMIGVKKTTDLLEKLTWGFAIAILALSVISNLSFTENKANDFSDRVEDVGPDISLPETNSEEASPEILQPLDAIPGDSSN